MTLFARFATAACAAAAAAAAPLALALLPAGAAAQAWPAKDITLVVPYNPGGSTDALARQFSTQLEKILKVNVTTENKPGGSGTIGMGQVVRAKPDGYTIGLATNSIMAYQPLTNSGLAWKTSGDYQPIVKLIDLPNVLYVKADSPWKNFNDFVADAKKNPGKLRVSVAALRGTNDLVMQQFNMLAGTRLLMVPFTGGAGEATVALLGGRVEAMAGSGATNAGHVKAGALRAIAVFQKGRYEPFPEAVSITEAGYDATLPAMYCVIAPKGLPKDVHDKLVAASLQVVKSEEWIKFAKSQGSSAIEQNGPEVVQKEMDHYTKVYSDLLKFLDASKPAAGK
ncbi:MAG TPA: tripartite tricarboxylate transporter substrate binding protein [Ramlibacter sp.]|nr:tripartite tricarboxylate transporter substrate binding protein [Ramlibacter sp.]